ncbi:hypothetical protein [Pseudomonas sp. RIT-To-2]|uniref:hypothetical protein n=1 Tax=Pseudomonas sp. RIT-To-2 TaxID=3462541 RepID=UPI0024132C99
MQVQRSGVSGGALVMAGLSLWGGSVHSQRCDDDLLTWHLRTELGQGPLALLSLRGFTLPSRIFLAEGERADAYALTAAP